MERRRGVMMERRIREIWSVGNAWNCG